MEKKTYKSNKSNYSAVTLADSTKYNNYYKSCGSSSDDDDKCKKKHCKDKSCKRGPPGPLVTTCMASPELTGLEPGYQSTYYLSSNCNNKYLIAGSYITIDCTSVNTPYFLIIEVVDCNLITIENVNEDTATWVVGATVALTGPRGLSGATGATLFNIVPIADESFSYGATLINNDGLISLELAPADNVNPGLLTATEQLVAGTKYFQDVFVAANFAGDPYTPWGGFDPGSIYFDTTLNTLQLYIGSTVGSTFVGTTWTSILTNYPGVTSLDSSGVSNGATFTSDGYLQLGEAGPVYPGLMTAIGQTFSGNKYFNGSIGVSGLIGVGNYSTGPTAQVGTTGSIYYNTTIAGVSGLQVSNGSTWASVKSFVIEHPKDEDKYLVHGCLEGPEAGVYYRGKSEITNNESVVVELPDYIEKLARNLTVQLTPIYDGNIYKPQYFASDVAGNQFEVHGVNGAFFWTVYGERLSFEVEPNKNDVELKGNGPYKWI
jgi:hypothetical protein